MQAYFYSLNPMTLVFEKNGNICLKLEFKFSQKCSLHYTKTLGLSKSVFKGLWSGLMYFYAPKIRVVNRALEINNLEFFWNDRLNYRQLKFVLQRIVWWMSLLRYTGDDLISQKLCIRVKNQVFPIYIGSL